VQTAALRVIIIGDSTASTYTATDPLKGWGQELQQFFKTGAVTVINKAIGGRSSRSFIEDGHWKSTLALMQKGDFLLISFGTNDAGSVAERHTDTAGFRQYLTQYVTESRAMGVIPILVSTVCQNSWTGTTLKEGFTIGANDYRGAMIRVVDALNVAFVDLEKRTAALFTSLGQATLSASYFNGGTHFQEKGAIAVAKCVAEGIAALSKNADVAPLAAALNAQLIPTSALNAQAPSLTHRNPSLAVSDKGILSIISDDKILFARIADLSGKSILKCEPNAARTVIDMHSWSHGTYLVTTRTSAGLITQTVQR
jgi:lysophospholipase L1-like esterase